MMQALRGKAGKIVGGVFAAALLLFLGLEGLETNAGVGGSAVGEVNGEDIDYRRYQSVYQGLYQQARDEAGRSLTAEEERQLGEQAWNQLVTETLLGQQLSRLRIRATDEEIRLAAINNPHPSVLQNELFLTNGQFDLQKYQAFLTNPATSEEILLQLEQYYREMVPREKLARFVTAGTFISDAELWKSYQDRNETATVEYVNLDVAKLVKSRPTVSDAAVREYYDGNPKRFKRGASGKFSVAWIPRTLTGADTAATVAKARALKAEIQGGADFAEVAKRESTDPGSKENGGDLGTFGRGRMVAAFEAAAFATPAGQISEPVLTPFGVHLIKVEERTGDQIRARHILLPIARASEAEDRLLAKADSLETLAASKGLERAASATGATVQRNVEISEGTPYLPGVGSGLQAVNWAGEVTAEAATRPVSELFETEQAFYVVRLESYTPRGTVSFDEAAPQIRQMLVQKKIIEQAQQAGQRLVAEVRGGKSFADVAQANGYTVEKTGPFTRLDANPVFGQANAVVGAAFGVPVGQVSDAVRSQAGLFIVRPIGRTQADRTAFEKEKGQLRAMVQQQLEQQVFGQWLQSVRKNAKIEDNREKVLRPGAV